MVNQLPEVVYRATDSISPYNKNPRSIPARAVEIVAASLQEFGWQQPIVVDKQGEVVAGHTRLAAAKSLGLDRVPVVVSSDLTPEQVRAFRIVDNRTHDFTSWDFPELVVQLEELSDQFSGVLALEDWQGVLRQFDDLTGQDNTDNFALGDDTNAAQSAMKGWEVTVCFDSKEAALEAGPDLIDLPGAFDVRNKF